MGALDPASSLPSLKSFALTHILYDPQHPLSIPLSLLSLSPIFLFVSYLTLLIFTRRLTILFLSSGQIVDEVFNLVLKRVWKAERPYLGYGEVGEGYGMPSSHAQAAGFLVAWGLGYWGTVGRRYHDAGGRVGMVRRWRARVWVGGLGLWSVLVSYSRWHLLYHSPFQVAAGYIVGLLAGTIHFMVTEYLPLYHPKTIPGRLRSAIEELWVGIGGIGGWDLGGAPGGWGEGPLISQPDRPKTS